MKLTNMATTVVASVFVVFSALGCCTKEKQEIAALMGENEELLNQKNDLQRQLSACDARLQSAMNQLDGKQAELAAAQARLQELEASQRQAPAVPQGWERGLVSDKVTVGTDILFAAGKATLTPQGKEALAGQPGPLGQSGDGRDALSHQQRYFRQAHRDRRHG